MHSKTRAKMSRIALFPGSFDPITIGHYDVITRALPLFDKIVIGVGQNALKNYMFPLAQRIQWIQTAFANEPKIEVTAYEGLTVNFCKTIGAQFMLRGLRNPADFEFEKGVGQANKRLMPAVESVFLLTSAGYSSISSSIVRDIMRNNGDYTSFVPEAVRIK
jgi:pantetheine-phosphate adenylyltransferase